jgi:hypothetical protein
LAHASPAEERDPYDGVRVVSHPIDRRRMAETLPERAGLPSRRLALEHVPEKWTRFSDKDMLPKFLNWREFFSIR